MGHFQPTVVYATKHERNLLNMLFCGFTSKLGIFAGIFCVTLSYTKEGRWCVLHLSLVKTMFGCVIAEKQIRLVFEFLNGLTLTNDCVFMRL